MPKAAMRTHRLLSVAAVLAGGLALLTSGCQQASSQQPPAPAAPASTNAFTNASGRTTSAPSEETWDAICMGGSKIGYNHTTRRELVEEKQKLWQIDGQSQMTFLRQGQSLTLNMRLTSIETRAGQLRRFESQINMGPAPTVVRGRLEGGQLKIDQTTADQTTHSALPWPAGAGGFFAVEESLSQQPLRPGETRRIKSLMPMFNCLAEIALKAGNFEETKLLGGKPERLLRVESQTTLSGQPPMPGLMWIDEHGDVLKTREAALDQETFRTTRELALGQAGPAPDLLALSVIKVDPPPREPHTARQIVYRVTLKEGDPAKTFPSGVSQSVKSLGPHEAEITVRRVRPGDGHAKSAEQGPTDADRRPNSLIQSDDAGVLAMAREPAPGEKDRWKLAVALESYVHRSMRLADYSQALASAAEVAKSREGDCTEYAVLLAALARARGIPARLAVGLVYAPSIGGFAYHMWTEMWIGDAWIPLDATLAHGGIGCGHLKLSSTNYAEGNPNGLLPIYQVIGQLGIKVVEEKR